MIDLVMTMAQILLVVLLKTVQAMTRQSRHYDTDRKLRARKQGTCLRQAS
jgi:hypothetical protein